MIFKLKYKAAVTKPKPMYVCDKNKRTIIEKDINN